MKRKSLRQQPARRKEPLGAQTILQPRDYCEPREGSDPPGRGRSWLRVGEGLGRRGGAARRSRSRPEGSRSGRRRRPSPDACSGLSQRCLPAELRQSPGRAAGGSPGTSQTALGALASCVRARGARAGGWLGSAASVLGSAHRPASNIPAWEAPQRPRGELRGRAGPWSRAPSFPKRDRAQERAGSRCATLFRLNWEE